MSVVVLLLSVELSEAAIIIGGGSDMVCALRYTSTVLVLLKRRNSTFLQPDAHILLEISKPSFIRLVP